MNSPSLDRNPEGESSAQVVAQLSPAQQNAGGAAPESAASQTYSPNQATEVFNSILSTTQTQYEDKSHTVIRFETDGKGNLVTPEEQKPAISLIQDMLISHGYLRIEDLEQKGELDQATARASKAFQADHGFNVVTKQYVRLPGDNPGQVVALDTNVAIGKMTLGALLLIPVDIQKTDGNVITTTAYKNLQGKGLNFTLNEAEIGQSVMAESFKIVEQSESTEDTEEPPTTYEMTGIGLAGFKKNQQVLDLLPTVSHAEQLVEEASGTGVDTSRRNPLGNLASAINSKNIQDWPELGGDNLTIQDETDESGRKLSFQVTIGNQNETNKALAQFSVVNSVIVELLTAHNLQAKANGNSEAITWTKFENGQNSGLTVEMYVEPKQATDAAAPPAAAPASP